jgi:hypothetical protein
MGKFLLGFKTLFRIWRDDSFAHRIQALGEGPAGAGPAPVESTPPPSAIPEPPQKVKLPARSEALTLLAVLQREARFVDFIKEPVADYTDAQIGAAVRAVHHDCAAVLDRLFAIEPLRPENEGAEIAVPAGYDPAEVRLVGNIPAHGPFRGSLQHPGWRATRAEVPEWNGRAESSLVVAPCELELK